MSRVEMIPECFDNGTNPIVPGCRGCGATACAVHPKNTKPCFGEYPINAALYAERSCSDCSFEEGCYEKWKETK